MNLFSFVKNPFTKEAVIDYDKLYEVSYEQIRLGDNLIDLEIEHIEAIINKIKNDPEPNHIKQVELDLWERIFDQAISGRRIGAGITAAADMIAAVGLKYGSKESLELIDKVMYTKMKAELDCTIDMAVTRGCFKDFDPEKEFVFYESEYGKTIEDGCNLFYNQMLELFPDQMNRMVQYGRRNVSWSTIAPTGSVSILTQTSSGCEPIFMPYYMRRKKINPSDKNAVVDFVDANGDSWSEFAVIHQKFADWVECNYPSETWHSMYTDKKLLNTLFEESPYYGATANDINWEDRIAFQMILQKYTTNAISSTLNLPSDISVDDVKKIYYYSWLNNLKGQTIYRDGCRTGVLVADTKPKNVFEYHDAPKRPKSMKGEGFLVKNRGDEFIVIVGLFDGKPYEVFAAENCGLIDEKHFTCEIVKVKGGHYNIESDIVTIDNFTSGMNEEQEVLSRLISTSLRHGTDIRFIVEQLQKTSGALISFSKVIARILKKYIPDGAKSTLVCGDCGGKNIVYEEGCMKCKDCGSSKCS